MADVKVKIGADASEFSRVMKGVRGEISSIRNLIGGLAAGAAAVYGVTKAVGGMTSVLKDASMEAAGIESLTMQFETLLGSSDAAKKRMEEIAKFAASTPFEISELSATSKLLQNLGGTLLATGDGLRMVGDAAAIAGQPLGEVGLHIGRVFNAITSGTSAGESVNRLQEIGLIGGEVKRKFEELAAAQKKGTQETLSASEALTLLRGVLSKTEGAMERLAKTTEGKLSNMADNVSQLKVAFGTGMNEGIKVALDKVNSSLPQFQEKFREAGALFGRSIADAVEDDTDLLKAIGNAIGVTLWEGLKTGWTAARMNIGEELWKWLEDINPLRDLDMFKDSGKFSDYISKGKGGIISEQADESIQAITDAIRRVPLTNVPMAGGASFRPALPGEESIYRDASGRMVMLLESINKNTKPQPFPN